jgi:hypothetical protein
MMTVSSRDNRKLAALAAVAALAALLRFFRLGHQSFWLDEILTVGSYTSPGGGISYGVKLMWDVHGPLYSLVMHFWSAFSSSEAWLRSPGAAAGVVTVLLMYLWARRESDERTALAAALLMAVNPFNIYYSQELRFYSFLTMFVVLSLLAFSHFDEKPSLRSGLLLGLSLGLACLSHEAARRPVVYRMEEGGAPPVLMAYLYGLYAFAVGFSWGPDLRELHEAATASSVFARYAPHIAAAAVVFGAAAAAGLTRLVRERRSAVHICVLAATVGLVTAAALLKIKVLNARYLMCAFPVFIVMVANGIPREGKWRAATLAALSLLMILSAGNYYFRPRYARDDFRGAARIIAEADMPGDLILAPGMEPVVSHYYDGRRPVESIYAPHLDREAVTARLDRMTEGRRRVWLVSARPWDTDAGGDIRRYFEAGMNLSARHELPGISLQLYEAAPGGVDTP